MLQEIISKRNEKFITIFFQLKKILFKDYTLSSLSDDFDIAQEG